MLLCSPANALQKCLALCEQTQSFQAFGLFFNLFVVLQCLLLFSILLLSQCIDNKQYVWLCSVLFYIIKYSIFCWFYSILSKYIRVWGIGQSPFRSREEDSWVKMWVSQGLGEGKKGIKQMRKKTAVWEEVVRSTNPLLGSGDLMRHQAELCLQLSGAQLRLCGVDKRSVCNGGLHGFPSREGRGLLALTH